MEPPCTTADARKIPRDIHEDARVIARRKMETKALAKSRDERKRGAMRFAHLKAHTTASSGCGSGDFPARAMSWAIVTITRAGSNVPTNLPTTTIVESGPYRFKRNPSTSALLLPSHWDVLKLISFVVIRLIRSRASLEAESLALRHQLNEKLGRALSNMMHNWILADEDTEYCGGHPRRRLSP